MQAEFQSLTILPRINSCNGESSSYKVFSDIDNFVEVEADTAMDAIIKSNIPSPLKVIKNGSHDRKILDIQDVNKPETDQDNNSLDNVTNNNPESQTNDSNAQNDEIEINKDTEKEDNSSEENPE